MDLEAEAGAHLLQPSLPRHRGLVHHLHAGVGHTLGHAPAETGGGMNVFTMMIFCASPLIESIRSVARPGASCELYLIGNNLYEDNVTLFP